MRYEKVPEDYRIAYLVDYVNDLAQDEDTDLEHLQAVLQELHKMAYYVQEIDRVTEEVSKLRAGLLPKKESLQDLLMRKK